MVALKENKQRRVRSNRGKGSHLKQGGRVAKWHVNKGLKRQRDKICRYQGARSFQVERAACANVLGQQSG